VRDDLAAIGHAYDWWRNYKDREQWKKKYRCCSTYLVNVP